MLKLVVVSGFDDDANSVGRGRAGAGTWLNVVCVLVWSFVWVGCWQLACWRLTGGCVLLSGCPVMYRCVYGSPGAESDNTTVEP